jgi:fermentation-respiration switch protein FrsA (DUF1100 family)
MRRVFAAGLLFCLTGGLSAAPKVPAHDETVEVRNGAVSLACTLSTPGGTRPVPAVVLISGSGPQDRDSNLGGFRPFKLMAEAFAARGIAVLRCDDRGVGGSSGLVANSTTEDFASDALAAVRMLRSRANIDRTKIGLLGHSEGAAAAAIAAARNSEVAFVVWMAGSAVSGLEIMQTQAATMARAAGSSESDVKGIVEKHAALMKAIADEAPVETVKALTASLATAQLTVPGRKPPTTEEVDRLVLQQIGMLRSPWMRFFIGFDPGAALRSVRCPVFAAFGELDTQVPADMNRTRLAAALADGGNSNVAVRVYEGANHLFMPAVTGHVLEYSTLPKVFVPSLLDDMAAWMLGTVAGSE